MIAIKFEWTQGDMLNGWRPRAGGRGLRDVESGKKFGGCKEGDGYHAFHHTLPPSTGRLARHLLAGVLPSGRPSAPNQRATNSLVRDNLCWVARSSNNPWPPKTRFGRVVSVGSWKEVAFRLAPHTCGLDVGCHSRFGGEGRARAGRCSTRIAESTSAASSASSWSSLPSPPILENENAPCSPPDPTGEGPPASPTASTAVSSSSPASDMSLALRRLKRRP